MSDEGERSPCRADQRCGAIAILHTGGKDLSAEQKASRFDENVALDAIRLFPSVVTDRVGVTPFFGRFTA